MSSTCIGFTILPSIIAIYHTCFNIVRRYASRSTRRSVRAITILTATASSRTKNIVSRVFVVTRTFGTAATTATAAAASTDAVGFTAAAAGTATAAAACHSVPKRLIMTQVTVAGATGAATIAFAAARSCHFEAVCLLNIERTHICCGTTGTTGITGFTIVSLRLIAGLAINRGTTGTASTAFCTDASTGTATAIAAAATAADIYMTITIHRRSGAAVRAIATIGCITAFGNHVAATF